MIGKIKLSDFRCFRREVPAVIEIHSGFTSFIGVNNAGKSALIKSIFDIRNMLTSVINFIYSPGPSRNFRFDPVSSILDVEELMCERPDPKTSIEIIVNYKPSDEGRKSISRVVIKFLGGNDCEMALFDDSDNEINISNEGVGKSSRVDGRMVLRRDLGLYEKEPIIDFINILKNSMYVGPFRNALNDGGGWHFDTAIGTGFIEQWHSWKTGPERKHNRAIDCVTDDVRRLIGAGSLEISASTELKTLQVNIDRRPHKLHELGAGIAQLILVLGNALIKKPSFIIIDEPEIHLHPSLQSEFLTTLASYAEHGVIFATHSIGLARSMSDKCFSVQKTRGGSIVRHFEKTPHYAEFLGSMGIAALQDIGWDKVLLVEGPKDVRTVRCFLRHYGVAENVIILPLGGDSMVNGKVSEELLEVRRLCEKVYAIVDSERNSCNSEPIKARIEFLTICENLGIKCCLTKRRAIENYLTEDSIKNAFGSKFEALDPYELPKKERFWGKGESWRAAKLMTKEDLDNTDIGEFFSSVR